MKNALKWPDGWGLLLLGITAITMVIVGILVSYDPIARGLAALAPDNLPTPCDAACETSRFDLKAQQHMALAAWAVAAISLFGAIVSGVSLYVLVRTVVFTKAAVDAAIAGNEQSRLAFVTDQRAWIKLEVTEFLSDLTWHEADGKLAINVIATNVGKTPATHVFVQAELTTKKLDSTDPRLEARAVAEAVNHPKWGYTAFPGDRLTQEFGMSVPLTAIEEQWAKFDGGNPRDSSAKYPVFLRVIITATYWLNIDSKPRVTAIFADLRAEPEAGEVAMGPAWGATERKRLRLSRDFINDTVAT